MSYQELTEELEQRVADRTKDLKKAVENAEKVNESKSEFLANMRHEIRTPMTAILGYSDLLTEDLSANPDQLSNSIKTIRSNANHLLTIINDILDVSKIEAGQMAIEAIPTNPVQIVEETASLTRPRAQGKGVEVRVKYESPAPASIQSDPTRLRQILLNLVGNAIKFTEVGNVTIHCSCDPQSEYITFRVTDTGIGMTPQQCEAISRFQAFTQADASTTRKFGGTGLGLRISNALATMLGGGITIDSALNEGSTFSVTIATGELNNVEMTKPSCPDSVYLTRHTAAETKDAQHEDATGLTGMRILLTEDGPDNQRLIKHHLTKAGAEVLVCDNGQIAVDTIESCSKATLPDVVLMDVQMPELDGYGAAAVLRERGYTLPIIALTAHAMEGDRQKCIDAVCDDYQTKPINKASLIGACHQWGANKTLRGSGTAA